MTFFGIQLHTQIGLHLMITGLDHIQIAMPADAVQAMRQFYGQTLGLPEIPKPAALQARGGFWARLGGMQIHFGIDRDFHPATKAHPALITDDITALAGRLQAAGHKVAWDDTLPDVTRFFTHDPAGNRVEIMQSPALLS